MNRYARSLFLSLTLPLSVAAVAAPGCGGGTDVPNPLTNPLDGPPAGYLDGDCEVPAEAGLEDVSNPRTVVGTGSPESCTGDAFIEAVAGGGVITFDCGPDPVTITLDRPAQVFNDTGPDIVIDGGGLVTLSGGGLRLDGDQHDVGVRERGRILGQLQRLARLGLVQVEILLIDREDGEPESDAPVVSDRHAG